MRITTKYERALETLCINSFETIWLLLAKGSNFQVTSNDVHYVFDHTFVNYVFDNTFQQDPDVEQCKALLALDASELEKVTLTFLEYMLFTLSKGESVSVQEFQEIKAEKGESFDKFYFEENEW